MNQYESHQLGHPSDEMKRARLKRSLRGMNVTLSPYAFEVAYARITTVGNRGIEASPDQIRAIVDDVLSSSEILQGVAESFR